MQRLKALIAMLPDNAYCVNHYIHIRDVRQPLAAVMANNGKLGEQRLLGEQAYEALHSAPVPRSMMALDTTFTQGGLATFPATKTTDNALTRGLNQGREGFYGWMGLGGSIFQWHPQKRIGFAYVPTSLNVLDLANERGKSYQAEVVKCLASLGA